jgi:tetratricopeptide (TPR) repeat protein
MVKRAFFVVNQRFGRRALIWAALLAAVALALDFVPLFDLLGYDFSFAVGLVAALAAVDIGQGVVAAARRPAQRWQEPPGAAPALPCRWRLVGRALAGGLGVLVAPFLLSLLNALRVRNCNLTAGLGFFALLPVATVIYAAPAGVIAGLAAPRRGRLLAFLLPLLSLAWALERLYHDPPVFAFDPFAGYFPGPIYDEALRPPLLLLFYRLANVVWIATAVALAAAASGRGFDPRAWRRVPLAVAVPLLIGAVALFEARGTLGFHVRRADLERALDGERRTGHFVVRYDASQGYTQAELALMLEDLEFRYHQLSNILGVEPRGPITVYEFPSAEAKKSLVGAGNTLYAKPWTREIFVQSERFPSTRLRHEMAHVFAGEFGDRWFGIALAWRWVGPIPVPALASGLIEGIAEAADFGAPDGPSTLHQEAAAMIADGRAAPLGAVVGAGFSTLSGARAYTLAGSFCRFLLETRGAEKLRQLYHSAGNFLDVYRTPLSNLEQEWREFLARQPLGARDRAQASEQFRRPAIFKKVCARELAARLAEARALLHVAPERAVPLLEETCHDDPHEPTFRLALGEAWAAAGQPARAIEVLTHLGSDGDLTEPMRARVAGAAGAVYFHSGDFANAEAAEKQVLALATDEGDRRTAYAKLRALASAPARQTLGRALYGDDPGAASDPVVVFFLVSEYARIFSDDRLGPYLVGRQLVARDAAHALPYLRRACGEDEGPGAASPPWSARALPPDFTRECRRMIADAAYRVGDFPRARAALARLLTDADRESERLRALDMIERVAWADAHPRDM